MQVASIQVGAPVGVKLVDVDGGGGGCGGWLWGGSVTEGGEGVNGWHIHGQYAGAGVASTHTFVQVAWLCLACGSAIQLYSHTQPTHHHTPHSTHTQQPGTHLSRKPYGP
jgi:hypothetical protein